MDSLQGSYFADIMNYKIGSLPIKYLRVHLHWKRPSRHDWQKLIEKLQQKLSVWKDKQLFLGGKLILLNYMLPVIPMYYISLFRIPKWVIIKIDQLRKWFLWAGLSFAPIRKYFLVKWATICRDKEFGDEVLLIKTYELCTSC
jgi:hypothetical protein